MLFMLSYNSKLRSIDLSNFNTQNVEYLSGMFKDCVSLTSLDLSNFNTKKVVLMYQMFSNCASLTSLNLSNFELDNAIDVSQMFSGYSKLKYLDISSFILIKTPREGGDRGIFGGLSTSGQIIINKKINTSILNQIPSTWNITVIE